MKSHQYLITRALVARLLFTWLAPVLVLALLLRVGAWANLLPQPWPALDVERTILTHQALASKIPQPADVLFIGDSSCLMNVRGAELERVCQGGHRCLNLGTFSYVGFNGFASMLSRYAEANPGRVRTVVLLVHPQMLRVADPVPEYLLFLSDYYAAADHIDPTSFHSQLCALLGLNILQGRLLSRLPVALPHQYGRSYGFNLNLAAYMDQNRGSAADPHRYVPGPGQGNAEYRLSPALEPVAMGFKAALPVGASLVVGLTPIPESFAPEQYPQRYSELLGHWAQWLGADLVLTNAPATLPDAYFASPTHLNAQGAAHYSRLVAQDLIDHLDRPKTVKAF